MNITLEKIARIGILFLILCNVPGFLVNYFGPTLGSLASYVTSLALLAYYFFIPLKSKPMLPFVILGILYFTISGLNYSEISDSEFFIKEFIRFMILAFGGAEVVKRTNKKEILFILVLGALSILINAFVFPTAQQSRFAENFGRFSGFYLNPNFAGNICSIGYALTFLFKGRLKLIFQFIFTLAGIMTFSRTFIIIWLIVTFVAIWRDKRNSIAPILGGLSLILVFSFSDKLTLNSKRFSALNSIFSKEEVKTEVIENDTRMETWSRYYNRIFEKPFTGYGYQYFQLKSHGDGVHNSYLMVIGEAGIIPFLVMIGLYVYLLIESFKMFRNEPEIFFMIVVLCLALMASHGYFNDYYFVLLSMFVYGNLRSNKQVGNK